MKILVVGSGGREHAIIRKLKQSPKAETIYCCPGNGGISMDAQCVDIKAMDIDGVVRFSKENSIDLVVVAPDDPLAAGMVDALNQEGIMTFGPTKDAAQIEASKVFSKNLMKEFHIPTAAYEVFDDPAKALCYIEEKNEYPVVIKADGLALGKGVLKPKIKLLKKQPPQVTRCEFVNEVFEGFDGWKLIIDLRCRKLTEDLIYQLKNEDGTKCKAKVTDAKTGVKYEKYGHLSDCLDYLLCYYLRDSWTKYKRGDGSMTILSTATINEGFNYKRTINLCTDDF